MELRWLYATYSPSSTLRIRYIYYGKAFNRIKNTLKWFFSCLSFLRSNLCIWKKYKTLPISGLSVDVTIMLDYKKWYDLSCADTPISRHFSTHWAHLQPHYLYKGHPYRKSEVRDKFSRRTNTSTLKPEV